MMILIAVALIAAAAAQDQVVPDIVYKLTDAYQLIWKDSGSEADMDGAVWRAQNYQSDYCSLGDVATNGHGSPDTKAVLVSQKKSGALAHPTSFTQIWTDRGSGADSDVAFYRMNAPSGYVCLGHVAMSSHSAKPNAQKYCCVKRDYLVRGESVKTWNDKGSGADKDVSLWTVIRAGGIAQAQGLDAGNFVSVGGYSRPASTYLLKADGNKVKDVWSLPTGEDKPLNLHEVGQLKQIWNDAGSGADADVSIWRAEVKEGYYPLGDIVVATHSKPKIGFLLRPTDKNDDSVRSPVSYRRIWNDRGSGADKDVQLWSVVCPAGFVSLGNIATDGSMPKLGDVYCVKASLTTHGSASNWGYVWRDHGSGADSDVSIFEARAGSSNQQSVRAFGAVASYHYKPTAPYFLDKKYHTYWTEKPIEKIIMTNVKYELSKEKQQTAPVKMSPTTVENFSDQTQTVEREVSYSVSESSSFTFSQSIQLGVSVEITAGSPLIGAGMATTISVESTSEFVSGQEKTETHTDSMKATPTIPPKSKMTAVIMGTKYKVDIPYTATITKVYYDESRATGQISGVYKGVAVSDFKVTYGEIEYF